MAAVLSAAISGVRVAAASWWDLAIPERSPGEVKRAASEVLSRPEYRQPARSVFERVRDWIGEQLAKLLAQLVTGRRASLLAWAVLIVAVGILAFFILRFVRTMTSGGERAVRTTAAARRSPAEWLAEAEGHEAAGRWRLAVRCRYRALIAELAERGLVDEIPGRTAGEYRIEVESNVPAVAEDFAGATELFELAWYGNRPTTPEHVGQFRDLARSVTGRVMSPVAGPSA